MVVNNIREKLIDVPKSIGLNNIFKNFKKKLTIFYIHMKVV